MRTANRLVAAAAIVLASWGCGVNKTDVPSVAGPSELALSLAMSAQPDTLYWDGKSQSELVIQALDEAGRPKAGVSGHLAIVVDGLTQNDFGVLSSYVVTTGSNGRTSVIYRAPEPIGDDDEDEDDDEQAQSTVVTIRLTPTGTDASAHLTRTVKIQLLAPVDGLVFSARPALDGRGLTPSAFASQ